MLQAMNTGHEGSMTTVHANTPRDAVKRLEQMVGMAGTAMTISSVRNQIASAVRMIAQLAAPARRQPPHHQRLRDYRHGRRRPANAGNL